MSESNVHELLVRNPLFAGLPQTALDEVLLTSKLRMIPAKTVLYHQGDTPNELIALGKGIVKVWQMRNGGAIATIHVLGPGDLVGDIAVFRHVPLPATATAITDCILLSWAAARTHELIERYPTIGANALGYVSRRSEELAQRLCEMATERVEQRIARALLRLADQIGLAAPEGVEIGYPLSRQDIAEIVGTDLYVVSRVLHDWAERGVIVTGRLRVVLCDRQRIEQIATDGK
ncbi:Crp/Fnr family transcriptional regulator [Roseomonas marmotae]|uniref:Crp/Fnr family transcriptional regulator n=1 Tax=Roseomonas marmotae TaxID=2768161 RepID=A0ABS3KEB7_9PROT|nr:Crp/Fnr family transcriptional regulator [Roseomonas marmotae]MBO1074691.1 Crp/Fnr family transcriptional regulator [Roseomonas marmotae]QTI81708.1 Crp/Fnr family transcriptional regulator [Roseomonas marmotae]